MDNNVVQFQHKQANVEKLLKKINKKLKKICDENGIDYAVILYEPKSDLRGHFMMVAPKEAVSVKLKNTLKIRQGLGFVDSKLEDVYKALKKSEIVV